MTNAQTPDSDDASLLARLRAIIASVFDVPADSIDPATCLSDLPRWTSLSFIVLMTAIEYQLRKQPDRERAWEAATVGDLLAQLRDSA
jgi:acyl carrier protein